MIFEKAGDALVSYKCQEHTAYRVEWSQKIGNECYNSFPVFLRNGTSRWFLDIQSRKIHRIPHITPCPPRNKPIFITDTLGQTWRLTSNDKFKKWDNIQHFTSGTTIPMPKLHHFTSDLLHYEHRPPQTVPLLSIIFSNIKTINDLHKINSKGKGNLIENIGAAIGEGTEGGSKMVRALGLGLKDALSGAGDAGGNLIKSLGSASSEVIHTTSAGLKEVLSSITNGILIWIFILAIALFLFLKFAPFSPFAIFQISKRLAPHDNQETQTPGLAQEGHKENHYTKEEIPVQNNPANTTY